MLTLKALPGGPLYLGKGNRIFTPNHHDTEIQFFKQENQFSLNI